jgi:hypothetical protein
MANQTVEIDPRVSLVEERLLVDHYRNRALFLSQRLFDSEGLIETFRARIQELEAQMEQN